MIKVLLCAPYGGVAGGISRWTEHIKKYHGSTDSNIDLCIVPMRRSMFVKSNMSIYFRFSSAWVDYKKIFRNYLKQIKRFAPDAVHLASSASLSLFKDIIMLQYARKCDVKTIVHFHFGRIPELAKKRNWEWWMLCKVVSMADKVVLIDRMSYKTMKAEGFDNIVCLSNSVSPLIAQIIEKQSVVAREPRKIVYAGHVVKTKGIYELVEACLEISDVRLVVVGRSLVGVDKELMQIAARKGSTDWITLLGEQPYERVVHEMRTAAVFALPSYTEGFPNVILESMACGCPIVATSVGAIPEMLADNTGIIIEPQAVEPLREALLLLLDNPQKSAEMGERAAERVMNLYSMPTVWKQLTDIWSNIK